jgi:6-phosphogluconolactonase
MRQGSKLRYFRLATTLMLGALVSVVGLTGCSNSFFTAITSSSTAVGSATYAYVTNYGGTLSAYTLTSGVLAAISGSPITLASNPNSIVVSPNNDYLYVGTSLGIYLYTIGTDGVLTEGNSDTIISSIVPVSMAMDSTNTWLIVASASTTLEAIQVTATTGIPTGTTASATLSAATATQVVISPANTQVFVPLGAGGTDAVGFTASSSTPFGTEVTMKLASGSTSANAVAVNSTSAYLFIAEATDTTGVLRVMSTSNLGTNLDTYSVGEGPSAVLSDATDAYVYVANKTDNTISGFSLTSSSGALSELTDSPFSSAKTPLALAEDSTDSYVLTVGYGNNPNFWVYSFDSTDAGTLDVATSTTTGTTDPSLSNAIALSH